MRSVGRRATYIAAAIFASVTSANLLLAITVGERDITCSICKTHNKVAIVQSWGSYACRPEGEFDLVPCPIAYTGSLWSCRTCRFTSFITDADVPHAKVTAIRTFLQELPSDVDVARVDPHFGRMPNVANQLVVAHGIYRILGRDKVFWSEFYRVAGFFAAREGKHQRAIGFRAKSLEATEQLLADPARARYRKEDLLVAGAMAAKLGDGARAKKYLRSVRRARYDPPGQEPSGLIETRKNMSALAVRILMSLP